LVCEAIGTAATPGLLCQPRVVVKMILEKQMECRLAGETEVPGENLPQRHFCPSQNPTWRGPSLNLCRRGGKPATNRLTVHSYSLYRQRYSGSGRMYGEFRIDNKLYFEKERDRYDDLRLKWRIILKWNVGKYNLRMKWIPVAQGSV
jgi:hypothetical protein